MVRLAEYQAMALLKTWYSFFFKFAVAYKADLQCLLLLFVVSLLFFWEVILFPDQLISNNDLFGSDIVNFFYPLYDYAYAMLREGIFPQWNSFILSGYPLAANPQLALFYPPNMLFLVLPTATAFGISYLLHVFLAGSFMYLLTKHLGLDRPSSILAAIIFMFCGFIMTHLYAGHYTLICAAVWLPLLFLFFDLALTRKSYMWGLFAGIVLGLQFLAGHIQITYLSLITLAIYLAYRLLFLLVRERDLKSLVKPVAIFGLMLVIGICLSAIQLFPTFEYSTLTTRFGGMSYEDAVSFSLHPGLISLLISNPWVGPTSLSADMFYFGFWEYSSYVGVFTILLVVFAYLFRGNNNYIKFFLLLVVVSIFLAFGEYFPPYRLLYELAPGFDQFRVPARFILPFSFGMSILAGYGFVLFRRTLGQEQNKEIKKILTIFFILALLLLIISVSLADHFNAVQMGMILFALLLLISIVILFLRTTNRIQGLKFDLIVISLVLINLVFMHNPLIDVNHISKLYQISPYITYLQDNSAGYRVYDSEGIINQNHNMIIGIDEITGYDATALRHYDEFLGQDIGWIGSNSDTVSASHGVSNLGQKLDLLNVKYVLSRHSLVDPNYEVVYADNDVYIHENKKVLPRVFIVHSAEIIESEEQILSRFEDDSFDVRHSIILQQLPAGISIENETGVGEANITRYDSQKITVETHNTSAGFLVLSETWYPSWKAYIDGKPVEVYKTDYALMSVYVALGTHTVEFVYEDKVFEAGIVVSITTVLLIGAVLIYYARNKRNEP